MTLQLLDAHAPQLLVVGLKGEILHASVELAESLRGVRHGPHHAAHPGTEQAGHAQGSELHPTARHGAAAEHHAAAVAAAKHFLVSGTHVLHGFTLTDFLPSPWRELHMHKYLKDLVGAPVACPVGRMSCRTSSGPTPGAKAPGAAGFLASGDALSVELRTVAGAPLLSKTSVRTTESQGQKQHVISVSK